MAFLASLVAVVGLVRTKQWGTREASEDTDREPREEAPSAAPAAGR
jgi:hypothetical protein